MLVPRKSEELRIKEQGMRQWQANVRRDPPGYESNPQEERLNHARRKVAQSLADLKPKLAGIKAKLETSPDFPKFVPMLEEMKRCIDNPNRVWTFDMDKLLQVTTVIRKLEAPDVIEEFKKLMVQLLKNVAKLESSKSKEDDNAVITLADLKNKSIKVDEFFNEQKSIKIDNTLASALHALILPPQESLPPAEISRQHVDMAIQHYSEAYEIGRDRREERPVEDDKSGGDQFTQHVSVLKADAERLQKNPLKGIFHQSQRTLREKPVPQNQSLQGRQS